MTETVAQAIKRTIATADTLTATELNILDGVTATAAELNYVDVATAGAVEASKAIVVDSGKAFQGALRVVEAHTAGDTLTAAESGSVHTSTGATGTITIVLPAATVGQWFTFVVGAAFELRIDPNTTQTIGLPSSNAQQAAGKYIVADAVGEYVNLLCATAGTWDVVGYVGTWTVEG